MKKTSNIIKVNTPPKVSDEDLSDEDLSDGALSDEDLSDGDLSDGDLSDKKKIKSKVKKQASVKKGPGRPRKTPKKEPIPKKGISLTSEHTDSLVEVLYDQPVIMKKIFQFFKMLAADNIQIIFRPTDIIFYAVDHYKKSRIRVKIDANKINNYYCKSIIEVGIAAKEMELILNKVDKDYSSVVILSTLDGTRKHIELILDNSMQIDETHRIQLIGTYNKMENEELFTDENYMIKFEFPSKYFKKTINDIKTMSQQLSIIQEDGESPIVFEYTTSNNRIHSKHTVNNNSKINLISRLTNDETFRVDMRIDYIKPIASSQISDHISILVDENKMFMTIAYIDDKTIEIKTLTNIIESNS